MPTYKIDVTITDTVTKHKARSSATVTAKTVKDALNRGIGQVAWSLGMREKKDFTGKDIDATHTRVRTKELTVSSNQRRRLLAGKSTYAHFPVNTNLAEQLGSNG